MAIKKSVTKIKESKAIKTNPIVEAGNYRIHDFINFIRSQGVVGLAVGLALGGAITIMVKSFIDNILLPAVGLLMGSADGLKGLKVAIGSAPDGEAVYMNYGIFVNDFINFIVIALVIYFILRILKVSEFDMKK